MGTLKMEACIKVSASMELEKEIWDKIALEYNDHKDLEKQAKKDLHRAMVQELGMDEEHVKITKFRYVYEEGAESNE